MEKSFHPFDMSPVCEDCLLCLVCHELPVGADRSLKKVSPTKPISSSMSVPYLLTSDIRMNRWTTDILSLISGKTCLFDELRTENARIVVCKS